MAKLQKLDVSLDELLEKSGITLWVQSALKHDMIIPILDDKSKREVPLYIPKIFPVCLSDQTTITNLRGCSDLFRLIGNGALNLIDPESIEDRYKRESTKRVKEMSGINIDDLKSNESDLLLETKTETETEIKETVDSNIVGLVNLWNTALDPEVPEEEKMEINLSKDSIINKLTELDLVINEPTRKYISDTFAHADILKVAWDL